MVFSSAIFLFGFLPIVFLVNWVIPSKYSNVLLLFASLLFYAWGEPVMVLLMVVSILLNWGVGLLLARYEGRLRGGILAAGIVADLGLLGYYKYAGFLARSLNTIVHRELITVPQIALPIGISFFTFQAMSYIIDVYRGNTEASKRLVNVALYISFFPQLIAGPIVKYRDINEQIVNRSVTWGDTSAGFKRFIYGLGKKVLIANVLGSCVDTVFAYDVSMIDWKTAWVASLAYSLQIYFDFSGYSDMAIGLGRMFGFAIPENFRYPYLSRSITEFWRRWHISLGSWFREYVYIPLGGNRRGGMRTYVNLVIVFLLTGLWHGANVSFILWGIYHGFFIVLERVGLKKRLERVPVVAVLYTDLVVNFGWVLFRANDTAKGLGMIGQMILPWRQPVVPIFSWNYIQMKGWCMLIIGAIGMGLLQHFVPSKLRDRWNGSVVEAVYCTIILVLSIASIASNTYNPFIYYQF